MSLEEQIQSLTIAVEKLHDLILDGRESIQVFEDLYPKEGDTVRTEEPSWAHEVTVDGPPQDEGMIKDVEIQGTDSKSLELIRLSQRMGYPYLVQDDKLIVDNEVLNAYSRENT